MLFLAGFVWPESIFTQGYCRLQWGLHYKSLIHTAYTESDNMLWTKVRAGYARLDRSFHISTLHKLYIHFSDTLDY